MQRVSSNLANNDMMFHLHRRQREMNKVQNQMAEQNRIQELRDDPVGAAHATRFESNIRHLERYSKNIDYAKSRSAVAEGYIQEAVDVLQRIREIGVQGANGTYQQEDMAKMGTEVNELLNELVSLANARGGDGTTLFSGTNSANEPFRALTGHVPGSGGNVITGLEYTGTADRRMTEISENTEVAVNFPGNEVFWAEQQKIYSGVNAQDYQVPQDTQITVDGQSIELKAGDNVHSIISKINRSGAEVKAGLDPVQNSLTLTSTTPHQIWIDENQDSAVLQDLGIVQDGGGQPPQNLSPDARAFGGSAFDMVIGLRDSLFAGDGENVGSRNLRGIDDALDNMLTHLADLGARDARMDQTQARISQEIPTNQRRLSMETDIDMAESITELKMLEHTHQAALSTSARIIQPTLMDFLR